MGVLDDLKIPFPRSFKEILEALESGITTNETSINNINTSNFLEQESGKFSAIRAATITLNGNNPSPINFQNDIAAVFTGSNIENFDLTGVGDGGTIIVNPDGDGDQTATINFAQGNHESGTTAATDISGGSDDSFDISVDEDSFETVTLTLANCDTGANTASEMQSKIQALGGNKASVTVSYDTDHYTITSPTYGTDSQVRIERADSSNVTEELELGPDGGTNNDGTGDVADASAATAQELVDVCNADMSGLTASIESGAVSFTSDSTGKDSSIAIGAGTLNTVLGLSDSDAAYGAQGLGYSSDMADSDYKVAPGIVGVAAGSLGSQTLSITNKAASGFDVECETTGATNDVDLIILGVAA